jgi:hypothetical protein
MLLPWILKAVRSRSEYRRRMRVLEASIGPRYLSPEDIRRFMRLPT